MLIIMKERGDKDEKWGILEWHNDDIVVIKHPSITEGQTFHKSHLRHLIASTKSEMKRKIKNA